MVCLWLYGLGSSPACFVGCGLSQARLTTFSTCVCGVCPAVSTPGHHGDDGVWRVVVTLPCGTSQATGAMAALLITPNTLAVWTPFSCACKCMCCVWHEAAGVGSLFHVMVPEAAAGVCAPVPSQGLRFSSILLVPCWQCLGVSDLHPRADAQLVWCCSCCLEAQALASLCHPCKPPWLSHHGGAGESYCLPAWPCVVALTL